MKLSTLLIVAALAVCTPCLASLPKPSNPAEAEFVALHNTYLARFRPLKIESEKAWWEASTTGTDEAFDRRKKAEAAIIELNSDHAMFAKVKSIRESGQVQHPTLSRLLDVMYNMLAPGQADPDLQKRISSIEAKVEQIFNTHRGLIDGKPSSENDIREILSHTKDSEAAEKAWKAYMTVGQKIEGKLRELVGLRNTMAHQLGYANFFSMKLALQEIDEKEMMTLFDELDELTRRPFDALKKEIDQRRASRFGIAQGSLRPWHFGDLFFQEAPDSEGFNLDDVLKSRDMVGLAGKYYQSMGMPIDAIVARSDLYERKGKSPHAFCTDLDREGDVRVLCNLKPNAYWMDTLVHELGHAVYDQALPADVPFLLREASHSLTTEGIAMMFGAMVKNQDWLEHVLELPPSSAATLAKAARKTLRAEKLIFCRWTQVMVRFERGMYSQPDQNLGQLWWDLKRRYQDLNPPKTVDRPDYAAKMHIVGYPVYYHSYMMGNLFASQVHHYVATEVMGKENPSQTCFYGSKKAGDFLRKQVFEPANLYPWNELTERATGEPLTAKYFAQQLAP